MVDDSAARLIFGHYYFCLPRPADELDKAYAVEETMGHYKIDEQRVLNAIQTAKEEGWGA